jgi:hypothetical protein
VRIPGQSHVAQAEKILDCGFWIENANGCNPKSKIRNPKSPHAIALMRIHVEWIAV